MSTPAFEFDPRRAVAFDVEAYPGRWLVGFYGRDRRGEALVGRVVDGDRAALGRTLERLARRRKILVGYNSSAYDVPMLRAILGGRDAYATSREIIEAERRPRGARRRIDLRGCPRLPCDHIDLAGRLRKNGRFPSLKAVAANLARPELRELPYPPDADLGAAEWAEIRAYNRVDLEHTWAVLEAFAPEIEALALLSAEHGVDLRSTSKPGVVETIFLGAYKAAHAGREPPRADVPLEVVYRPPAGVRRPRTAAAAAWFDAVAGRPLRVAWGDSKPEVAVPPAAFALGGLRVSVGRGGIHSIDPKALYRATDEWDLLAADVASFYPALIDRKGIFPRAYGALGAGLYRAILDRRLALKAAAKAAPTGAERHRLEVAQYGLKIVLNSTFGKFGSRHSTLFDLEAMLGVTLSGQLLLIDLLERLGEAAAEVLSANTDGLIFRARRGDERWRAALEDWQRDTEMVLEVDALDRVLLLGANCYATRDAAGAIKRKGAALKGDPDPEKASNAPVVADAVAAALLADVPPEVTIAAERRWVRFCSVTRTSAQVREAVVVDAADGSETPLPKVSRWYKAAGSTLRLLHRLASGKATTPAKATGVRLALALGDGRIPRDLDAAHYVAEARKVLNTVPGAHRLDPALLPARGPAREAFERGLAPFPKDRKALPLGASVAAPTWLWDWPRYPTLGTLTGPRAGILVLDVDEALKFKKAVDRNNSPLLADRWDDLADGLVSCRGEATPDRVRQGKARGKLIFRVAVGPDHWLATLKPGRWRAKYGVEVFYGHGIPSLLGAGPDGTTYRLDGALGPPPAWLLELLQPPPPRPRSPGMAQDALQGDPAEADGGFDLDASARAPGGVLDALGESLGSLRELIAEADPLLNGRVGWRRKDLADGRPILVGTCPYHTGGSADLHAGWHGDGVPYVACKHESCAGVPEASRRLGELFRRRVGQAQVESVRASAPPLVLTPIARSYDEALARGARGFLGAATGAGKTYAMALAAVARYRRGEATCIALPTNKLCDEVLKDLAELAPDAVHADAIARVYDRAAGGGRSQGPRDRAAGPDAIGRYPIFEHTRIVVTTHANLLRRGASRFVPGFWAAIEPGTAEAGPRPPMGLLIDELGLLIAHSRFNIPLEHRVRHRRRPDGRGGRLEPVAACPLRQALNGSCVDCTLHRPFGRGFGRVLGYNGHNVKEFQRVPHFTTNAAGSPVITEVVDPLVLDLGDFTFAHPEPRRVAHTVFANSIVAYRGRPIDARTRLGAPVFTFHTEPEGGEPAETPEAIFGHLMEFGFEVTLIVEQPIGPEGGIVTPEEILAHRAQDPRAWRDHFVWPRNPCQVPFIVGVDLYGLEKIRRYAERHGRGVVFADGTPTESVLKPVREVFPDLETIDFPDQARKIEQVALVALEGYHSLEALVTPDRTLVFDPLHEVGKGLVFTALEERARRLFKMLRNRPGGAALRLATDGDLEGDWASSITPGNAGTILASSHGYLGRGANLLDLRYLVVDANLYHYAAGFNTATITAEEFARLRAEDRLVTLRQNLGRALRGEPGKRVVVFVLDADADLVAYLRSLPALVAGSERPPLVVWRPALAHAVAEAKIWLTTPGGDWPAIPPPEAPRKGRGRPPFDPDQKAATKAKIRAAARQESQAGKTWREFARRHHPDRAELFQAKELEELKDLFKVRNP
ncbi:MAG: hypothetical protein JO252_10000 [Planctomycetaceae bacterium]|nr:hypothetical protein [Planctomycetaceae bacterium]MBV8316838.1 hypothetical protein [Planctomycetaceae bacterium]MBV8382713.1 hypothetical protein [Planctomycetaceae bacterium]